MYLFIWRCSGIKKTRHTNWMSKANCLNALNRRTIFVLGQTRKHSLVRLACSFNVKSVVCMCLYFSISLLLSLFLSVTHSVCAYNRNVDGRRRHCFNTMNCVRLRYCERVWARAYFPSLRQTSMYKPVYTYSIHIKLMSTCMCEWTREGDSESNRMLKANTYSRAPQHLLQSDEPLYIRK